MVVVTVVVSIINSTIVAVFVPTVAAVVILDPAKEVEVLMHGVLVHTDL